MGVYGFSSSDDDAEYTPPNEDVDQDKDGDRYVILIVLSNLDSRARFRRLFHFLKIFTMLWIPKQVGSDKSSFII